MPAAVGFDARSYPIDLRLGRAFFDPNGQFFTIDDDHHRGLEHECRSVLVVSGVHPTGDKCTALLLDDKTFRQARPLSGKLVRVDGISLPRVSSSRDTVSTQYLDRTLVEGTCADQPFVVFVTRITAVTPTQ
jgi:hypothetical protein